MSYTQTDAFNQRFDLYSFSTGKHANGCLHLDKSITKLEGFTLVLYSTFLPSLSPDYARSIPLILEGNRYIFNSTPSISSITLNNKIVPAATLSKLNQFYKREGGYYGPRHGARLTSEGNMVTISGNDHVILTTLYKGNKIKLNLTWFMHHQFTYKGKTIHYIIDMVEDHPHMTGYLIIEDTGDFITLKQQTTRLTAKIIDDLLQGNLNHETSTQST